MTAETWALFVLVSILPAMSPGPAILLAISNSVRFGASATLFSALANSLGLTVLGLGVAFGLSAVMNASAAAFTIMKIVGALYLGFLGVKLWITGKSCEFGETGNTAARSRKKLFFEALLLAVTNPKGLVLLAALLPPFIDRSQPVLPQAAILSITFAVMCFFNHLLLAFASGHTRRFLTSKSRMRTLRCALGTMFLGFGAALALSAR
jgi:homoserine/homoserine lactone efflux protein